MFKKVLIFTLLLGFMVSPATAKEPLFTVYGKIVKVSDGDTVQFLQNDHDFKLKLRLYGIDAPETEKGNKRTGKVSKPGQPYGEEAFKALKSKIYGKTVMIQILDKDKYKRMVSVVWIGDRNINKEMVAEGWAWAYRKYLDRPHASEYIDAEEQARKAKRGLWKQANPTPPWEFRKKQRMEKEDW